MIHLNYNETKTITFYLQPSLSTPVYLLSLVNYTTRERMSFIAEDSSTTSTMLQFSVTEIGAGTPDLLDGMFSISNFGRHTIEVYEQTSTTNIDPTASGTTLLGDDEIMIWNPATYSNPPLRNPLPVSTADYNNDYNNDYLI